MRATTAIITATLVVCANGAGGLRGLSGGLVSDAPPSLPDPSSNIANERIIGEVMGNAKVLCTILEAMDCWQEKQKPKSNNPIDGIWDKIGGFFGSKNTIEVSARPAFGAPSVGEAKFVAPEDMLVAVRRICKAVDGGVDQITNLLPELAKEAILSGLDKVDLGKSGNLLKKLLGGKGLDFGDIFQAQGAISATSEAPDAIVTIPVHDAQIGQRKLFFEFFEAPSFDDIKKKADKAKKAAEKKAEDMREELQNSDAFKDIAKKVEEAKQAAEKKAEDMREELQNSEAFKDIAKKVEEAKQAAEEKIDTSTRR